MADGSAFPPAVRTTCPYCGVGCGVSARALYDRFAFSQRFFRIDPWAQRVAGRESHEFNPMSRRMEFEPA